jgi:uncharacterized protein (UPF0218 family)
VNLPQNLREQLKIPLGLLIRDTTKENITRHIPADSYVVTVGDATTEKMLKFGITPSLQIVDGLEKRTKRILPSSNATKLFCNNPAAEITPQSIQTIKEAFRTVPPVQIVVNGEEDLLVIPVCIHAPDNAIVMYGQPNEGLVVVKVTQEIRNKTQTLLDLMK